MLDEFLVRALIAGIGIAVVAGPLGCFVVWRRMAYFGDTMAHSALLGVAMALFAEIDPTLGVLFVALMVAGLLLGLESRRALSTDALLGILSHAALALGIIMVSVMPWVRVDLISLLFGDILAVSWLDVAVVLVGGSGVLGVVALWWPSLLAATISPEIAAAEGMRPDRARVVFVLLMAVVIAAAMKVIGILLITALLIIPAATARRLARTPEGMAVAASLAGAVSVILGLYGSWEVDTPSGPSIVVAALILFIVSIGVPALRWRAARSEAGE